MEEHCILPNRTLYICATNNIIDATCKNCYSTGILVLFENEATFKGGSIFSRESLLKFAGCSIFNSNMANTGGAMHIRNTTMQFDGDICLLNNSAKHGGALQMLRSQVLLNDHALKNSRTIFKYNEAKEMGGSIRSLQHSALLMFGSTLFYGNSAANGGAIYADQTDIKISGYNMDYFQLNTADNRVVLAASKANVSFEVNFIKNEAKCNGGSIMSRGSVLQFAASVVFSNNSAQKRGGALKIVTTTLKIAGYAHFVGNSADRGGAMHIKSSNVVFSFNSSVHEHLPFSTINSTQFCQNKASVHGGSIKSLDSLLEFRTGVQF